MTDTSPERALAHIAAELESRSRPFALVGGLGVSIRGEVRFTRAVDLAIAVASDAETEQLVRDLSSAGYRVMLHEGAEAPGDGAVAFAERGRRRPPRGELRDRG